MFNLVIKDILIQKKQLIFSLVYLVFILVTFQGMGEAMFPMGLVAMAYMLSMTACAYEEKNRSDLLLNSLPIKRESIVASKYLSVFVYTLMVTALYEAMVIIINILNIPLKTFPLSLEMFIGGLVAVCSMTGIYFPIYFKFGYMKMRVANFVLFFLFFFGSSYMTHFLNSNHDSLLVNGIINFFNTQSDITISLVLLIIIAVYMLLSFLLSAWFYNRREF
ncbi:ABC-2 transporter permease [Lutispora thermophila]|uniref:ABC-2 family transporter protein n=1 Tax=Lutispora thermophila DSM 19022 TaxID=1122184 RepID=A0A1M6FFI6_9FIRM|nr:ABC-2 transporter permease [Lutispora thermophila]SHI96417.1 ABC-2 family transporter protein [Lutispora thermophila DSM 19022]